MKTFLMFLVCLLVTCGVQASAVVIYSNDFSGTVGSEWSKTSTDITPIGARRFLGQFHSESARLSLGGLPSHSQTTVSFDLFVIRTWDGNLVEDPNFAGEYIGPDVFDLTVVDGPTLVHTTFNNHDFYAGWTQAYPSTYPGGSYAPRTGAVENNTLGFVWDGYAVIDSVYHLSYTFDHSNPQVSFMFSGSLVDWVVPGYDPDTESWGLDNVQVSATPVPEPPSLLTLLSGFTGLSALALRRWSSHR